MQDKSSLRELLLEHIFYIISHRIAGFDFPCTVHDGFLLRFRKLCETIQDV